MAVVPSHSEKEEADDGNAKTQTKDVSST